MTFYYHSDNIIILIMNKEDFPMKKKCIIITAISFVTLFLLTFIFPEQIIVNGGIGEKMEISIYFILLLSPIPAFCYWSNERKKKGRK